MPLLSLPVMKAPVLTGHLPKRHRRRPQLLSQPIPRRGRRQQWARPRTRIHQHGVDFRGQNWKIQPPLPLPLTMRSHLIVSPRRGERGHFDKLICNIPIAYKRADICGALMPISACISCSAALTGWWSGTVASGEAGGLAPATPRQQPTRRNGSRPSPPHRRPTSTRTRPRRPRSLRRSAPAGSTSPTPASPSG